MPIYPLPLHWACRRSPVGYFIACTLMVVATSGCSDNPLRLPVKGTVTVDGEPLASGQIVLVPLQGTRGPTAGAEIVDGEFSIASSGGPLAGKFRVEVTAAQTTTGRKQADIDFNTGKLEQVEGTRQLLPPRYNSDSELTLEVTSDGPNRFNFELQSH
ncbi:hypothetical protein [Adhaeretor mobilis]|nr:hypothetical protein [Adhaeretor mobilis]